MSTSSVGKAPQGVGAGGRLQPGPPLGLLLTPTPDVVMRALCLSGRLPLGRRESLSFPAQGSVGAIVEREASRPRLGDFSLGSGCGRAHPSC